MRFEAVAQVFQFGAQLDVIVNFSVKDNPAVAIVSENGLIASLEVDDLKACSAEGKQIRLRDALLVGPAVNQRSGRLPDSFRRRAPVFSGKAGNPAQRSAPSVSPDVLAKCSLEFQGNRPTRSLS